MFHVLAIIIFYIIYTSTFTSKKRLLIMNDLFLTYLFIFVIPYRYKNELYS